MRSLYLELLIGNALSVSVSFGSLSGFAYRHQGTSLIWTNFALDVGYEGIPKDINKDNKQYEGYLKEYKIMCPRIHRRNMALWMARKFGWYYDKSFTYPNQYYPMVHFARNRTQPRGRGAGHKDATPSWRFELDSLIHLPQNVRWQMKVQPGRYLVTVTIGDKVSCKRELEDRSSRLSSPLLSYTQRGRDSSVTASRA